MTTKHTPGPWIFSNGHVWSWATKDTQPYIAQPYSREDGHLIAAAPDLLAALDDLRSAVGTFAPRENNGKLHPQLLAMYDRACAAIARAKGEHA